MRNLVIEPRITEEWLKENGFRWEQFDRQPSKHWLLWLGAALVDYSEPESSRMFAGAEDLGLELASNDSRFWFCWLRSDVSHHYGRFLHTHHLVYQFELVAMIEGLTGREWEPHNAIYGALRTPTDAERERERRDRIDVKMAHENYPWHEHEKDEFRATANSQHVQAAIDGGKAR